MKNEVNMWIENNRSANGYSGNLMDEALKRKNFYARIYPLMVPRANQYRKIRNLCASEIFKIVKESCNLYMCNAPRSSRRCYIFIFYFGKFCVWPTFFTWTLKDNKKTLYSKVVENALMIYYCSVMQKLISDKVH